MFSISSLLLEVTRRCNMSCEHCLRGDAQRLDMSREVIDRSFKGVGYISTLALTGGEPSLAVPVIEAITDTIRRKRMDVGSFWVCTNGKTKPATARRFALALLDLYSVMTDHDEDLTRLVVSGDAWHEAVEIPSVYTGLAFYREKEGRHGPKNEEYVIISGRAAENGIGGREPDDDKPFEVEGDDLDHLQVDMIYVAANGNVLSDCNHSYKFIDTKARGNVLRGSLQSIVAKDAKVACPA